jgi:hypothetical protein
LFVTSPVGGNADGALGTAHDIDGHRGVDVLVSVDPPTTTFPIGSACRMLVMTVGSPPGTMVSA